MKPGAAFLWAALLGLGPVDVLGQERAALFEAARSETGSVERRLELFAAAANPALAPLDSVWAQSVYDLAQALTDLGEAGVANAWLRWAAWLDGSWPMDPDFSTEALRRAFDEAKNATAGRTTAESPTARINWDWPERWAVSAPGFLSLSSSSGQQLTFDIEGRTVGPGASLELQPGSHRVDIRAAGLEAIGVDIEVLPGVRTNLDANLVALLSPESLARVSSGLLALRSRSDEAAPCVTSIVVDDQLGRIVVPLEAVRGDSVLRAFTSGGAPIGDAQLIGDSLGLALLRVPAEDLRAIELSAGGAARGLEVWAVDLGGCMGTPRVRGRRVLERVPSQVVLDGPVGGIRGALVGADGGLVGATLSDEVAVTAEAVRALIDRAGRPVAGRPPSGIWRRRWPWIGLGAVAVGTSAYFLLGGGDPAPGSIVITVPLG